MTDPNAGGGQAESRLRVFRPSRSHCLGTIAHRMGDGWHLTGVERTARGAYVLDFAPPRGPQALQPHGAESAVVANEHALADAVVDLLADRLSSGWRLTTFQHTEQESYLVEFTRSHRQISPEGPDA
jgi:hypothetical protein